MKFILTGLGNWAAAWKLVRVVVPEAEKLGFWGVVFPDQYMWDKQELGVESYDDVDSTLDTWIELAHLAAETKKIYLGTWVTPIPLRHPGQLAKIVSTVDMLSEGRTLLGVGAGSTQRLFEAYGEWGPPRVRVDRTREGIELILKLWNEGTVDYDGSYYRVKQAVLTPKPVQRPHPPLMFGGSGRRMLQLAGRFADICYVPRSQKTSFEDSKKIIMAEARSHRRETKVSFAEAYTPLGPDQTYSREQYRGEVEQAVKKGFDYFVTAFNLDVAPWEIRESNLQKTTSEYLSSLHDFAENVMQDFR